MAEHCSCLVLALCLVALRNSYASDEHLLCKKVKDIFSAGPSANATPAGRGMQGPPGKRGVPGQMGDRGYPGLPGEPGIPDRVDYDKIESYIEAAVLNRTAAIEAEMSIEIERQSNEVMNSLAQLEGYKSKLEWWSKRLGVFMSPKEGEIMLVNRDGPQHYGRVEIFHAGEWGTVCDDNWDLTDANVVCRMLNFTRAIAAPGAARYGQGRGKIWLDDVICGGRESDLGSCSNAGWGIENCGHGEDASVVCEL